MPLHELIRIGTIGGIETFAGAISQALVRVYPEFSVPTYYSTGNNMFAGLASGEVDAVIGAGATTGDGFTVMANLVGRSGSQLYVIAEELLPFNCALLGRAGAKLSDVRKYFGGPASITQAESFIAKNLPRAASAVCSDPLAVAQSVAESDGSLALLGTPSMAKRFSLQILAQNVDGGAVNGAWWVVSSLSMFAARPTILVVTSRLTDEGSMGCMANSLGNAGFSLSTVFPIVSKQRLLEFDCVMRFRGSGTLDEVQSALTRCPGARLAGAIRPRLAPDAAVQE